MKIYLGYGVAFQSLATFVYALNSYGIVSNWPNCTEVNNCASGSTCNENRGECDCDLDMGSYGSLCQLNEDDLQGCC